MSQNKNYISAKTLLDLIVEFVEMTPELDDWGFEQQKENPPRLIRLQQIDVLSKLLIPEFPDEYTIKKKILSIYQGEFIKCRAKERYQIVFDEMDEILGLRKIKKHEDFEWNIFYLKHNYCEAFEFKKHIRQIKKYNKDILEIGYAYAPANLLIESIASTINTEPADIFIISIIDPLKQTFLKTDLVKNHGYPDADITDIDKEWV